MARSQLKRVLPSLIHFRDMASNVVLQSPVIGVFDNESRAIGDLLDDNTYGEDFYRYHDVYHYAKDQILRYSPVLQSLKGLPRTPRDVSADECSVLMMHQALESKSELTENLFHETHRWIWGHKAKSQRADIEVYKQVMLNAHDVFEKIVAIKEENPQPLSIAVGYNFYKKQIEVSDFKPLTL